MTREKHRRWLIELLTDRRGARDYYLGDEDKKVIVEALSQPERPKGRWVKRIRFSIADYTCSKCGCWTGDEHNYCPDCGADMRGEKE